MTEQQLKEKCRQAAAIGFAQSLENRGYTGEKQAALVVSYAKEDGILTKQATVTNQVIKGIFNTLAQLHSN